MGALHARDGEHAADLMVGLTETNEQLQERLHVLLNELF
jgi:hypothetical protein